MGRGVGKEGKRFTFTTREASRTVLERPQTGIRSLAKSSSLCVLSACSWQIDSFLILCQLQTGKLFSISPSTWDSEFPSFHKWLCSVSKLCFQTPRVSYIVPNRKADRLFPGVCWLFSSELNTTWMKNFRKSKSITEISFPYKLLNSSNFDPD